MLNNESFLVLTKQKPIKCDFNTQLYSKERHWMAVSEFVLS